MFNIRYLLLLWFVHEHKMDIGELLSYKPEQTPKRHIESDDEEQEETHTIIKKQKAVFDPPSDRIIQLLQVDTPNLTEEERRSIIEYVDNENLEGTDVIDEAGLKKFILIFEKRVLKNQEMRIKFPEQAEKFMESEVDLHNIIQELHAIATVPDLYPVLVELNCVPSLLELLAHANTDISVDVVDLLQEMTDVDILHESLDGTDILIENLRQQQLCALLVQNLDRFDESVKEESDGVHNTFSIFENLFEIKPDICKEAAEQGLMQWILKRLKAKVPFDDNKLYCSEILSVLIQDTPENRQMLGTIDGIDVLLQQLAVYKRHDPASDEEQEFMENLFNCVCSALMLRENRDRFLKGEGLQLMNLMLREKKLSRNGSLKVLDYAMSGPDGKDNCSKFVDILGLRTLFPLFMKTPKRGKKRLISSEEHEEHVASIISSMLRNCKGSQRQRMLAKFTENDHEKVDRLLELHLKYLEKVEIIDQEIDYAEKDNDLTEEEQSEHNYLKRLSNGLFILQLIDYIILEVSTTSDTVKQRIQQILNLRGSSMKTIRHIMREYAGNLGDAGDTEWRAQEEQHIIQLIDRF